MDRLRIVDAPSPAPRDAGPAKRILVVDDLPEIGMIFKDAQRRLRHMRVDLVTETNSDRAAAMAGAGGFDVVVSDFRMRQVDGIHVLTAARKGNPGGYRILMTGYNEIPASLDRIREAGVDAYLRKPLQVQDLLLLLIGFLQDDASLIEETRKHARRLEEDAETATLALG